MDCSLAALIACFSWGGLYVDTGMSYQDAGFIVQDKYLESKRIERDGLIETLSSESMGERHKVNQSPYGRFSLGYELSFTSVTLRLEASHVSSLDTTKDRGVNSIGISARWFPFR